MKKLSIVHFVSYYVPHVWWLENFVHEFSIKWGHYWYGDATIVTSDIGQNIQGNITKDNIISDYNWQVIGYKSKNINIYTIPSFELIKNFPVPKIWDRRFFSILSIVSKEKNDIIITHTRFFIYALLWVFFAKIYGIHSVHIEHGSDFVVLKNKLFTFFAYVYDVLIGKVILKMVDKVVAISNATKKFLSKRFKVQSKYVIYRWYNDFYKQIEKDHTIKLVFIGRLVKLKWIELLMDVYQDLYKKNINIDLFIFGDGPERKDVEVRIIKSNWHHVHLLGYKDMKYIQDFLLHHKCIILMPSLQEWLWTVAIEWLLSKNVVVASNAWGIAEVSNRKDLCVFESWDKDSMMQATLFALQNYDNLAGTSYDYVRQKFSWEHTMKQYKSLFESILAK
jgi:glycosyltransferase involved in cell wall biosynthesis